MRPVRPLAAAAMWCAAGFLSAAPAPAHPGVGIVMDARGYVYYTDLEQVWRRAPDGTREVAVPDVHTHELCLDAAGNLYGEHLWYEGEASDRWGHYVWRLRADGGLERILPATAGLLDNYSFVRDGAGNMYWGDRRRHEVRKRTPFGAVTTHARLGFRDLRWMTATAEGVLFLIDDGALLRIGRDGQVRTLVADLRERRLLSPPLGARHALMGLWTDAAENVYVASHSSREVKRVDRGSRVVDIYRSPLPWFPTGGLIAPDGALWVLEYSLVPGEVRVVRVPPEDFADQR